MGQVSLLDAPALARFQDKVRVDEETGCWEWRGARKTARQYGSQPYGNFKANGRVRSAHRFIYETLVGPVPSGLELDHQCRNRLCCNPDHLEPVTHGENMRRGASARRPGLIREAVHA